MELRYKVPERLRPYLEFIPVESISEMITVALERAIQDRSIMGRPHEIDSSHLTMLAKIEAMLSERAPSRAEPTKPKSSVKPIMEVAKAEVAVSIESSSDEDIEANFLLDIMR